VECILAGIQYKKQRLRQGQTGVLEVEQETQSWID
jgi:hypothetical protein